jgi:hypothetical protein
MLCPANVIVPDAVANPLTASISVVLPAPLGPINPDLAVAGRLARW